MTSAAVYPRSERKQLFGRFAHYVSTNVGGMLALSFYILADTYFIAQGVGSNGLAALNFVVVLWTLMSANNLMIAIGGGTQFKLQYSRVQYTQARQSFTFALIAGLVISLGLVMIALFFTHPVSYLLGAEGESAVLSAQYMSVLFLFAPAFFINALLQAFVRNDGSPKLAMIAMISASFANVILDWYFIFVLGWGMAGAALATGISPALGAAILSIHVFKGDCHFKPCAVRFEPLRILKIMGFGFSHFIIEVSSGIILFVFNLIMLHFAGVIGVAAYGVIANLSFVAWAIFYGVGEGLQPLVSEVYAKKRMRSLVQLCKFAAVTSLVVSAALIFTSNVFTAEFVSLFNSENNAELQALASQGLRIYFWAYIFAGLNIVFAAVLSAIERPKLAWIISLMRGLIVSLACAFVLVSLMGAEGLWWSFILNEALVCSFTLWAVISHIKKLIQAHPTEPQEELFDLGEFEVSA